MYKVETYPLGIYQANCYLLWQDHHVVMIDPGGKSGELVQYLKEKQADVQAILLTHGHFDHIGGVDYFAQIFKCPVFIDQEDEVMLHDTYLNCSLAGRESVVNTPVSFYRVGKNTIKNFTFEVLFAPGHTLGCTILCFDELMFSGDVIFQGSIGRCDLPQSDPKKMKETIQMIKQIKKDYIVYPGHGPTTSLKEELLHNPYFI
ncbi:MAG: MBL fold metallo-hydrolase [Erysipelotrichia bacterium]|nr:MBL fold metallo-hydrolase [Erysipelotrichia bacterium]NCC54970.1 MBL fold metallo-hydrolase [Erysipelotrichia bacterium]